MWVLLFTIHYIIVVMIVASLFSLRVRARELAPQYKGTGT